MLARILAYLTVALLCNNGIWLSVYFHNTELFNYFCVPTVMLSIIFICMLGDLIYTHWEKF